MKAKRLFLFVTLMTIISLPLMAFAPMAINAVQEPSPPDPLGVILVISIAFASLVGVAALVAVVVQIGKLIGVVKDSTANQWAAGLNLLCFIALVLLGVFRPDLTLEFLDGYAGRIAQALIYVLGFVIQITGSQPIYARLKAVRFPLLSKSYSA
jgi:hypothetical protein